MNKGDNSKTFFFFKNDLSDDNFQKNNFRAMDMVVFNATFNNISAISWQSVLLVEETGVPGENQTCSKSLTNFMT
jgi:hypothetical protein